MWFHSHDNHLKTIITLFLWLTNLSCREVGYLGCGRTASKWRAGTQTQVWLRHRSLAQCDENTPPAPQGLPAVQRCTTLRPSSFSPTMRCRPSVAQVWEYRLQVELAPLRLCVIAVWLWPGYSTTQSLFSWFLPHIPIEHLSWARQLVKEKKANTNVPALMELTFQRRVEETVGVGWGGDRHKLCKWVRCIVY